MNPATWGATDADIRKALPGDDLVLNPRVVTTRAITIHASIAKVWPWLVQIGYKRAGWYSYDFICDTGVVNFFGPINTEQDAHENLLGNDSSVDASFCVPVKSVF